MGYQHFPAPKAPAGVAGGKCPDQNCGGVLKEWDCGCSWGCDLCWVYFACSKCHTKTKAGPVRGTKTKKPLQQCPHCGAKKVGLANHIRDKHGPGNRTPAPKHVGSIQLDCPDCGAPMKLNRSRYGLFYGCTEWRNTGCKGSHGAHPNGLPLGIPADSRTKKMRMAAHNAFDPLWNGPEPVFDSRGRAYRWIESVMCLNTEDAHIGKFNSEQCAALIEHIWDAVGDDEATA